jgi:hypothetical protein
MSVDLPRTGAPIQWTEHSAGSSGEAKPPRLASAADTRCQQSPPFGERVALRLGLDQLLDLDQKMARARPRDGRGGVPQLNRDQGGHRRVVTSRGGRGRAPVRSLWTRCELSCDRCLLDPRRRALASGIDRSRRSPAHPGSLLDARRASRSGATDAVQHDEYHRHLGSALAGAAEPHRLLIVERVAIDGTTLQLRGLDGLDGTPLIDLKAERGAASD